MDGFPTSHGYANYTQIKPITTEPRVSLTFVLHRYLFIKSLAQFKSLPKASAQNKLV
jgi:hypothetical protein